MHFHKLTKHHQQQNYQKHYTPLSFGGSSYQNCCSIIYHQGLGSFRPYESRVYGEYENEFMVNIKI